MKLSIAGVCDVGSVRENNEDMILVGTALVRDGRFRAEWQIQAGGPLPLIAVADGMGGANAGEVASRLLLERLRDRLGSVVQNQDEEKIEGEVEGKVDEEIDEEAKVKGEDDDRNEAAVVSGIKDICKGIHGELLAEGASDPSMSGMGSTLIALLWHRDPPLLINAGDSRLYRHRGGTLMQLSRDHSLRALYGDAQAPSNIVVNSFGGGESFYVDVEAAGKRVLDGDIFLLCSDGISDALKDDEIEAILSAPGAEDELLAAAKRNGGRDNISYVLVTVQDA